MDNKAPANYIFNMKLSFLWYLLCALLFMSCSPSQKESVGKIDIPELKEYYEPLMKEAQKWSPDAYLYSVDIPIGKKPWLLSAGFYATTKNKESFAVTPDLQGKISGQVFIQEPDILQQEPILISQWEVDSQEALDILIAENAEAIKAIRNLCGSLILNRGSLIAGKPLVWKFGPRECGSADGIIYYLNPITGEVISP